MNVPQYKNRVTLSTPTAAGGSVAAPRPESFDRGAAQIAELGKGLAEAGEAWKKGEQQIYDRIHAAEERKAKREQAKRLADVQLAWQKDNDELLNGKLDENGNAVKEGLLQRKLANAGTVAKEYFEKGGELVNKYAALAKTPEEEDFIRRTLARGFQDNYDRAVRHQLGEERKSANNAAEAFFASSAGMAGSITRPQDMRAHLDGVYKISDDNGAGNGLTAEELKLARYAVANQNMTAAVQGAVWNKNVPAARKLLTALKSDLLPDDWNRLNWYVLRAEEAAQKDAQRAGKAGAENAKDALYERAIKLMGQNPQSLQTETRRAQNDMYAFQQRLAKDGVNVDAQDLKTYLKWVQDTLDDPDGPIGAQKRANFAAAKTQYDAFDVGKEEDGYQVFNKDLDTPAALAGAVSALRARMTDGAFTREDAKTAQTYLDNLRRALGARIKNKPESSWFSISGDEFLQNAFHKNAQSAGDALTLEDLAGMYEDALDMAGKRKLDLQTSYKDAQYDFDNLLTDVRVRFASAKYGVPVGVAEAAVYNGRIFALTNGENVRKPVGAAELDSAIKDYQTGKWNGTRLHVKKEGGEIVDMYYGN